MYFNSSTMAFLVLCAISFMTLENSAAAPVKGQKISRFQNTAKPIDLLKAQLFRPKKKTKSRVNKQPKADNNPQQDKGYARIGENTEEYKELTLYIPRFTQYADGRWAALIWGQTNRHVWDDTRFNQNTAYKPKITKEIAHQNYIRNRTMSTVCMGKSTIYNVPANKRWLKKEIHAQIVEHRILWNDLRREIFNFGRSEECHNIKYNKWLKYQNCALRRNQRIEYLIPKYPLSQRGYRFQYKIIVIE